MIELEGNGTSDDDAQLIAEMGIVGMTNESDGISTKNLAPVTGTFVKHEGESLSWTNVNMVVVSQLYLTDRMNMRDNYITMAILF